MKKMAVFLGFLFFLISSAAACDRCFHQTKAAYFSKTSQLSSGSCGYGSLAIGLYNGHLAAGSSTLFDNGGCGACFQVRCKNETLCSSKGITVVLTNLNHNNRTDLVLSSRAFKAMAKKGMDQDILRLGLLDVEYKRVPCVYKNKNLALRVEESSHHPDRLAVKVLYQGGQTQILAMNVAQVGSSNLYYMSRIYGAVWNASTVPEGDLIFQFVIMSGFDPKWYVTEKPIPANWKPGVVYDTGIQFNDISKASCPPCE